MRQPQPVEAAALAAASRFRRLSAGFPCLWIQAAAKIIKPMRVSMIGAGVKGGDYLLNFDIETAVLLREGRRRRQWRRRRQSIVKRSFAARVIWHRLQGAG
jgi:hypothetical protein